MGNRKVCAGEGWMGLELWARIWRGWIVPVGGSTPDRLKAGTRLGVEPSTGTRPDRHRQTPTGSDRLRPTRGRRRNFPALSLSA